MWTWIRNLLRPASDRPKKPKVEYWIPPRNGLYGPPDDGPRFPPPPPGGSGLSPLPK